MKYCLNEKDLTNLHSQSTDAHITDTNSLSHMYNLDPTKIKQLQQQDVHITNLSDRCKSEKNSKISYYLDEHGIAYKKIRDGPNMFHAIMVPNIYNHMYYMNATTH